MKRKMEKVKITSDGTAQCIGTKITCGKINLGMVQAVRWGTRVGRAPTCIIETILTPAELQVLQENTTFIVTVRE